MRQAETITLHHGKSEPVASVIMPLFKGINHVEAAIESILHQKDSVLEILISDDASGDETPDKALRLLKQYKGPHRILFRRGSKRLGIDHFVLLVESISSDICIMAHQDDVAFPNRASKLIELFETTGADVVSSNYVLIDDDGKERGKRIKKNVTGFIPIETIIKDGWQPPMIGAALAWRRSVFSDFPRLDSSYLNGGHDLLIPFRGAIRGGFYYFSEPLMRYRRHASQWTHRLHDNTSRGTIQESIAARSLGVYLAMNSDIDHLKLTELKNDQFDNLREMVRETALIRASEMFKWRRQLLKQKKQLLWVDSETFDTQQRSRFSLRLRHKEPFRSIKDWLEANFLL